MFEVEDLRNASPATVSRAGIIYVSETDLGWRPAVDAWLATLPPAHGRVVAGLIDKYVGPAFIVMEKEVRKVISCPLPGVVNAIVQILSAVRATRDRHARVVCTKCFVCAAVRDRVFFLLPIDAVRCDALQLRFF